ncbi:MAG TPA: membrane protein insertase YidC, partial [Gammaproteobacteria bacterium]|nr:membrane protein insertase YidC [Gammaproteobacteria bacterium]
MNNQKLFLGIAIFLTVFLLWDKWQITHITDENGNVVRKSQITLDTSTQNTDVPMINIETTQIDLPTAPSISESHGYTTVTTDLLTVEISHKGGTIQNAYLNAFPIEKGGEEKFQLLSDKTGALFQAQSGLASRDDLLPTHLSLFNSANSNYQLSTDTLTVPLTWQGKDGTTVTKNFHFKKGSYIV